MPDSVTLSKAQRLSRISYFLYRNPRGLTASELARLCDVHARTILRDLEDLETAGVPIWEEEDRGERGAPRRFGITEGYYVPPIHLSLDDALALFLAGRLLARYADSYDPHIVDALAKLANILPESIAQHVHATILSLATRKKDQRFVRVLGVLALGWAASRAVHIHYRSAGNEEERETDLQPYFMEPSAMGSATYVIGHATHAGELRTFKVERISEARLLDETFVVPEDFDGPTLLQSAWGIMYGDEAEEVVLRFAPSATSRIRETHWHPTEQVEACDDGGCILRLTIANPLEMVHWIRGWGPQVEVLAPGWLREQMAEEALETGRMYGESDGS